MYIYKVSVANVGGIQEHGPPFVDFEVGFFGAK